MQVRQVRVERARRLLRAVADGGGQPSAKRWPHAVVQRDAQPVRGVQQRLRRRGGHRTPRAPEPPAHPPGPLVSRRAFSSFEGSKAPSSSATSLRETPSRSSPNRETSFFSFPEPAGESGGSPSASRPHPLSTSRNRMNACMRVMSRAEYSSARGDGRVVPPRVKLERHRQDILRRVHQRRRRVPELVQQQARGRRHVRARGRWDARGDLHRAGGLPRAGLEETRVQDALDLGVPQRAHALRVGKVPEHQRHAQVRRRQVGEKRARTRTAAAARRRLARIGQVQHVLLGVHAFAGEVARVAAGGRHRGARRPRRTETPGSRRPARCAEPSRRRLCRRRRPPSQGCTRFSAKACAWKPSPGLYFQKSAASLGRQRRELGLRVRTVGVISALNMNTMSRITSISG